MAQFSFEGSSEDARVVAVLRFEDDICAGWLAEYLSGENAIWEAHELYFEKCDLVVFFRLSCKFHSWVDAVETVVEGFCWVSIA